MQTLTGPRALADSPETAIGKVAIQKGLDALFDQARSHAEKQKYAEAVTPLIEFIFGAHPELQKLGFSPFQLYVGFVNSLPEQQRFWALDTLRSYYVGRLGQQRGDPQRSVDCFLSLAHEMVGVIAKEQSRISDRGFENIFGAVLEQLDAFKEDIPKSERQSLLKLYIQLASDRHQDFHEAMYIDLDVAPDVMRELGKTPANSLQSITDRIFTPLSTHKYVKGDKQTIRKLGDFFSRSVGHLMEHGRFSFKDCFESCKGSLHESLASLRDQGLRTDSQNFKQVAAFVRGVLPYLSASLVKGGKIDQDEWNSRFVTVADYVTQSMANDTLKFRNALEFYEHSLVDAFRLRTFPDSSQKYSLQAWKEKFDEFLKIAQELGKIDAAEVYAIRQRIEFGKPILEQVVDAQINEAEEASPAGQGEDGSVKELFDSLKDTVKGYKEMLPRFKVNVEGTLRRGREFVGSIGRTLASAHLPKLKSKENWMISLDEFVAAMSGAEEMPSSGIQVSPSA
jgi:hypothetical protein